MTKEKKERASVSSRFFFFFFNFWRFLASFFLGHFLLERFEPLENKI
jgi:hypothetical protein